MYGYSLGPLREVGNVLILRGRGGLDLDNVKLSAEKRFADEWQSPVLISSCTGDFDGVEVETVPVERIVENKSLVDHRLVMGVSKAIYDRAVKSD